IRPDWMRFHWLMNVITRAGGVGLCYFLIRAGSLVVSANVTEPVDYHRVAQVVNQTVYYGIWLTAVISIVHLANDLNRLVSTGPQCVSLRQSEQRHLSLRYTSRTVALSHTSLWRLERPRYILRVSAAKRLYD